MYTISSLVTNVFLCNMILFRGEQQRLPQNEFYLEVGLAHPPKNRNYGKRFRRALFQGVMDLKIGHTQGRKMSKHMYMYCVCLAGVGQSSCILSSLLCFCPFSGLSLVKVKFHKKFWALVIVGGQLIPTGVNNVPSRSLHQQNKQILETSTKQ